MTMIELFRTDDEVDRALINLHELVRERLADGARPEHILAALAEAGANPVQAVAALSHFVGLLTAKDLAKASEFWDRAGWPEDWVL